MGQEVTTSQKRNNIGEVLLVRLWCLGDVTHTEGAAVYEPFV